MKLDELKQLAINKKNDLINKKNLAYNAGEIDQFYVLDQEISEIDIIIEKLQS
jgi:hypothetical protein